MIREWATLVFAFIGWIGAIMTFGLKVVLTFQVSICLLVITVGILLALTDRRKKPWSG